MVPGLGKRGIGLERICYFHIDEIYSDRMAHLPPNLKNEKLRGAIDWTMGLTIYYPETQNEPRL